jgi:hypothetical protein
LVFFTPKSTSGSYDGGCYDIDLQMMSWMQQCAYNMLQSHMAHTMYKCFAVQNPACPMQVMSWMDQCAYISASRQLGSHLLTYVAVTGT